MFNRNIMNDKPPFWSSSLFTIFNIELLKTLYMREVVEYSYHQRCENNMGDGRKENTLSAKVKHFNIHWHWGKKRSLWFDTRRYLFQSNIPELYFTIFSPSFGRKSTVMFPYKINIPISPWIDLLFGLFSYDIEKNYIVHQ